MLDINSFFVILEDSDGAQIHVPNNLLFQRYVKHISGPAMENDTKSEEVTKRKRRRSRSKEWRR